jgi:hypothetical protein
MELSDFRIPDVQTAKYVLGARIEEVPSTPLKVAYERPIGLDAGSYSTYTYVNDDPLDYIDPKGLASSGAPLRRVRDCNSDEWTQCEAQCAGKGVRSCKRQQLFQPVRTTNRDGTVLTNWVWKDQGLSCDCKDPDACKNAIKNAAAALGLSVTTYLIISEGSRLFPPRNLVPVP